MSEIVTKLGINGRLVIPAPYREALGLRAGDELILRLEGEELRLLTPSQAVKRAQALVRRYIPEGTELSSELITERREAAKRE